MNVRSLLLGALLIAMGKSAVAAPCDTTSQTFVVNGITCELSGVHTFDTVQVINGGVINVPKYVGGDKNATGNLELRANAITIDATSKISARGAGYQTPICGDGQGPTALAGGRGGCGVFDSGGGGAHFGRGGRGTKDIGGTQQFPRDFEEDCGNSVVYTNGVPSCSLRTNCRNSDGLPSVAGEAFAHSIYQAEFGGSGGDKGCRDGDGTTINTSGGGGGRIVLAAVNATQTGTISIAGTLDANGKRGCGNGNDSGGGGAGGTLFIVGDNVAIAMTAKVQAAGGLGGDTQGLAADPTGECTNPAQQGGTCDDCGGGGGGGLISVLSINANIADESVFNVNGALGGVCPICRGEAGGGVGELQIAGGYVGEFCDGFDNDFDGLIDENLGDLNCAGVSQPACVGGVPQICPADVPTCIGPVTDTRARFTVIMDTSGSMLGSLTGVPTFGDGSLDHPGRDQDGNGQADDSRLYKAKRALTTVMAAYPDIDFALARYHQDTAQDRSCQVAPWFECNNICCTYDDPANNTGDTVCTVNGGSSGSLPVKRASPGDECINYAGNCGPPRRGADVLVGFGTDINQRLTWLDGRETAYNAGTQTGDYCAGGDCELRGTGPTPLANALAATEDYLAPLKACDAAAAGGCRRYGVILLTDGAESCQGDPVAAAAALRARGIDTFVVGFSTLASETAQLNAIAAAGGTGAAFLVGNEEQLANALATIVSNSIVFETCNNLDDDCDSKVDEDFPQKGGACDNGQIGACRGTGTLVCAANGAGVTCDITQPGATPMPEVCNGLDDNCNGAIDDGITCTPGCTPTSPIDLCNGIDDDCDGQFEEDDTRIGDACGASNTAPCRLGQLACLGGNLVCVGEIGPDPETCNGLDDNCDGVADDAAQCPNTTTCIEGGCRLPCSEGEFPCQGGFACRNTPDGAFCVPDACGACQPNEICQNNACVDPCAGVNCTAPQTCRLGTCVDCNITGCGAGQICVAATCVADPCAGVNCAATCTDPQGCSCRAGACVANCDDVDCPVGERCAADGSCQPNTCQGVACNANEVCSNGTCVKTECGTTGCGVGLYCQDGACIDDPCKQVECSAGFQCEVRDSAARCAPKTPGVPPDRVTTGGGGCSTTGERSRTGFGWLWLLAMAFALRGRAAAPARGRPAERGWHAAGDKRRNAAVRATTALAARLAVTLLAACNITPFDLSKQNGSGGNDANVTDGSTGQGDGNANPVDAASCVRTGPDDTCDELDNDCDGKIDNAFNKQEDPNNCGQCGHRCSAAGAVTQCEQGACKVTACQPGFADLNGDQLDCEYRCPLFPPLSEECNGTDDDCDGRIDEELGNPPQGQCRTTPGTPCAGTAMVCATRNGVTQWYCNYGPDVEFDPSIPNGIVLAEQKCDGKDGDCDAIVDDTFTDLGQQCDDGGLGVCRDAGLRVCDPADPAQTKCDLTVLPDAMAPSAEACDGKDNDCNGVVDDATGPNRVIDAMVHVVAGGLDFYVDAFEASHPDASMLATGVSAARACSNANVLPWRGATFAAASAACAAAGKELCSGPQWQAACDAGAGSVYPYGMSFEAARCNAEPYDGIAGGTDDDVLIPTGALTGCTSQAMAFDLSGNLKEWTNDITGTSPGGQAIAVLRGGAYDTPAEGASCTFRTSRATVNTILPSIGFRCCKATAP